MGLKLCDRLWAGEVIGRLELSDVEAVCLFSRLAVELLLGMEKGEMKLGAGTRRPFVARMG